MAWASIVELRRMVACLGWRHARLIALAHHGERRRRVSCDHDVPHWDGAPGRTNVDGCQSRQAEEEEGLGADLVGLAGAAHRAVLLEAEASFILLRGLSKPENSDRGIESGVKIGAGGAKSALTRMPLATGYSRDDSDAR